VLRLLHDTLKAQLSIKLQSIAIVRKCKFLDPNIALHKLRLCRQTSRGLIRLEKYSRKRCFGLAASRYESSCSAGKSDANKIASRRSLVAAALLTGVDRAFWRETRIKRLRGGDSAYTRLKKTYERVRRNERASSSDGGDVCGVTFPQTVGGGGIFDRNLARLRNSRSIVYFRYSGIYKSRAR